MAAVNNSVSAQVPGAISGSSKRALAKAAVRVFNVKGVKGVRR